MTYQTKILLGIGTGFLFFAVVCFIGLLVTASLNTEHGKLKTPYPNILDTMPVLSK